MKRTMIVLLLLLSHSAQANNCLLCGEWISNEQMTLESMNKSGQVTKKQRDLFSKNFFGKLKLIYTQNKVTTFYAGETTVAGYTLTQNPKSGYTIKLSDDAISSSGQEIWFTNNHQCYYSVIGNLHFNEYFCKTKTASWAQSLAK